MTESNWMRAFAGILVLAGAAMVVGGFVRSHEVATFDSDELEELLGFVTTETISDREMIEDATWAGVTRRKGRLYSTYDRSAPPTNRACPT